MVVQALLRSAIARIEPRPVGRQPVAQVSRVAALHEIQHEVGAQIVQESLAVRQVGADLRFDLAGDSWQQEAFQSLAIGLIHDGLHGVVLVQARALQE
ncbi:hypothetical protein D3C76_1270760 [compost metagenome]